jgi:hypothetical protein
MIGVCPRPDELTIPDIIELFYLYQYEQEKCHIFYFNLIGALKVADHPNLKRLKIVYPNFVYVLKQWQASGDYGNDLFKAYNIGRFKDKNVIDVDA